MVGNGRPLRLGYWRLENWRLGKRPACLALAAAIAGCLAAGANAQEFTKADSGWVPLFNGTSFEGIYGRLYSQPVTPEPDPTWQILYPGTDSATIRGSSTSKQGNIGTKKNYSHYRMRVMYRHDVKNGNNNAGVTYHTDETKPRMDNNWPFSIECQMKQSESGSAFSIAQLTFDTRASAKAEMSNWAATGGVAVTACATSCDGRSYRGSPLISGGTQWNQMEIIVRGSDTAWHYVNNTLVFKLWNMRERSTSGVDGAKVTSGGLGLQAEGALINYRHWEIMELPASGPNYLNRLFLTAPDKDAKLNPQDNFNVTWKKIGDFKKVMLQYSTDGSTWKNMADSVDNTGSYAWKVPSEATKTLRVRISGPAYVRADTSSGNNEITGTSGLAPHASQRYFLFAGQRLPISADGAVLDVQNVSGKVVRTLRIGGQDAVWDLRDGNGNRVQPGLYFARVKGKTALPGVRAWVF